MKETAKTSTLPKLNWKKTTCEVCGDPFDYFTRNKPRVCKKGECKYKYHYKINPETWATYQPSLFE